MLQRTKVWASARPPQITETFSRPRGYSYHPDHPLTAAFRAKSGVNAAATLLTISIFDYIGDDGFSDARMSAALRAVGPDNDILVEINSPGGDYFQGVAMFNMLQRYSGAVTVQVLGIAASAASVVAMAGDKIEVAQNAEIMIHKASALTFGNADDHAASVETLGHIDQAMASTYAARSGRDPGEVLQMMAKGQGAGTFLRGQAAVDMGFADGLMSVAGESPAYAAAEDLPSTLRDWDTKLAEGKPLTRAERREMFAAIRGTQDAAAPSAMQDAGVLQSLAALASTITPSS